MNQQIGRGHDQEHPIKNPTLPSFDTSGLKTGPVDESGISPGKTAPKVIEKTTPHKRASVYHCARCSRKVGRSQPVDATLSPLNPFFNKCKMAVPCGDGHLYFFGVLLVLS